MVKTLLEKKEKKVEYIELIYDLIFVYIIGRNNLLLHDFADGFVALPAFFAYVMTTLAVIQIWNYTTYYINIYGRHSLREHVFLFINMFLLYFIGESTRSDWQRFHTQYHVAWALILVNIGLQYLIELHSHKAEGQGGKHMIRMAAILLTESLPDTQRKSMRGFYVYGKTAAAVARELHYSASSIAKALAAARAVCALIGGDAVEDKLPPWYLKKYGEGAGKEWDS